MRLQFRLHFIPKWFFEEDHSREQLSYKKEVQDDYEIHVDADVFDDISFALQFLNRELSEISCQSVAIFILYISSRYSSCSLMLSLSAIEHLCSKFIRIEMKESEFINFIPSNFKSLNVVLICSNQN